MSFTTWHNYGYGICFDGIEYESVEKLKALLDHAPKVKQKIREWFDECEITEPTMDDYLNYDQDYNLGMGMLLRDVIAEAEGIELLACDDFDGNIYLMYPPMYPWNTTKADLDMTEEKIEEVIRKYLGIVAENDFDVDYQSAENGG